MEENGYVTIIVNGEPIGTCGRIVNVNLINSNKKMVLASDYIYDACVLVMAWLCIKEILFFPS